MTRQERRWVPHTQAAPEYYGARSAKGTGLSKKGTKFCVICCVDRDPTGGRFRSGLFTCALHAKAPA